jgi:hypothetical protein
MEYKLILKLHWVFIASPGGQPGSLPEKLLRRKNIRVPEAGVPVWGSTHPENKHISASFGPQITWQLVRQAERKHNVLPEQEHLTR